jgi:hypothetical protein
MAHRRNFEEERQKEKDQKVKELEIIRPSKEALRMSQAGSDKKKKGARKGAQQ